MAHALELNAIGDDATCDALVAAILTMQHNTGSVGDELAILRAADGAI